MRRSLTVPARRAMAAAVLLAGAPIGASADDLGKQLFVGDASPPCAVCHALSDAGANGAVGPSLDDLKPSADQVRAAVSQGVGIMPSYGDALSAEEIEAIASYVASAAGA